MSDYPCVIKIRGLPNRPDITEINVRSGPGINFDIAFKGQVGLKNLPILDVQKDSEGKNLEGKVYQWFKLIFPDSREGWIRDDLLAIQGDCARWGYGVEEPDTFTFALLRKEARTGIGLPFNAIDETAPFQASTDAEADDTAEESSDESKQKRNTFTGELDLERVRKAAFKITEAFEGGGYAAYNNYDSGIISYGIIQFTLSSGNLAVVINAYLEKSNSDIANQLRAYQGRIQARDGNLRNDDNLKRLLISAADEPEMQAAQDARMKANYWDRIVDPYISQRQYQYPLTYALLFDIGVNFGVGDGFVRMAEKEHSVPTRSNPTVSGISEEQIIATVAELRKISHDKQAARDNLPGLSVRGNFWVDLVRKGDWGLQGDGNGVVNVNGKKVQVANP